MENLHQGDALRVVLAAHEGGVAAGLELGVRVGLGVGEPVRVAVAVRVAVGVLVKVGLGVHLPRSRARKMRWTSAGAIAWLKICTSSSQPSRFSLGVKRWPPMRMGLVLANEPGRRVGLPGVPTGAPFR